MSGWRKRLEITANVLLIICGSLFCVSLVRIYLLGTHQHVEKPARQPVVGKKLEAADIEWANNQQTLLLVLQRGCRFCDESAPFYRRLTEELSAKPKTRMVAVLPSAPEETKQYLEEKKIEIPDVRQLAPRSLGVAGTPTLLLVDNNGVVVNEWRGKLSSEQEQSVIDRLNQ